MYELMVEDSFDAAHALRGYEGPCENVHGHGWRVQVFLKGTKLNKLGLLEDFKAVKKELSVILALFDHKDLNNTAPFLVKNPTSENLAEVVYKNLRKKIKNISKVTIWESPTTNASYY
jgi:6-pyruvoyltetrahydropterin/6-carboxytetrahydropterin synthase